MSEGDGNGTRHRIATRSANRDRILANTRREGDCLVWAGTTNGQRNGGGGYGLVHVDGRVVLVHRWLYQDVHGVTLERNQFVCHSCDNKPCINIDHLWVGSNSDNMRDYVAKGLYIPRVVLDRKTTVEERAEIAARYERYTHTSSNARALAAEYGISHSRVRQIVAASRRAA